MITKRMLWEALIQPAVEVAEIIVKEPWTCVVIEVKVGFQTFRGVGFSKPNPGYDTYIRSTGISIAKGKAIQDCKDRMHARILANVHFDSDDGLIRTIRVLNQAIQRQYLISFWYKDPPANLGVDTLSVFPTGFYTNAAGLHLRATPEEGGEQMFSVEKINSIYTHKDTTYSKWGALHGGRR